MFSVMKGGGVVYMHDVAFFPQGGYEEAQGLMNEFEVNKNKNKHVDNSFFTKCGEMVLINVADADLVKCAYHLLQFPQYKSDHLKLVMYNANRTDKDSCMFISQVARMAIASNHPLIAAGCFEWLQYHRRDTERQLVLDYLGTDVKNVHNAWYPFFLTVNNLISRFEAENFFRAVDDHVSIGNMNPICMWKLM